jgi:hypothetical protein
MECISGHGSNRPRHDAQLIAAQMSAKWQIADRDDNIANCDIRSIGWGLRLRAQVISQAANGNQGQDATYDQTYERALHRESLFDLRRFTIFANAE